jgi:ribosomal protein S18 acetylase RimI-like enzyme
VTFAQAVAGTVALLEGRIAGYQLSTRAQGKMHLARLAVHPEAQRLGIGRALVQGVIRQSVLQGQETFTVNTQSENVASLRLYHSLGFVETGEDVPLFCAQLGE